MMFGNIFTPVNMGAEEFSEVLARGAGCRVERIVSCGHVSPEGFWYDQDEWEWVAVTQGSAELEFQDSRRSLSAGDWILIPAHERHRVAYTSTEPPCVWLAVFGQ